MKSRLQGVLASREDPREILGVGPNPSDDEIRAAYLRKIKENPPERSPAAFERIRDAYEALKDPRRRALHMLLSADPEAPLAALLPSKTSTRNFAGPDLWLAVLKEK